MSKLVRTASVVLLLTLTFVQSGGMLMGLTVFRQFSDVHARYVAGAHPERLRHVLLSKRDYNASRVKEDEIRLGSALYDVVSVVAEGDSISLCLYHDAEEENILDEVGNWLGSAGKKDHKGIQWLSKILSSPQQCAGTYNDLIPYFQIIRILSSRCLTHLQGVFLYPTTPPPDCIL